MTKFSKTVMFSFILATLSWATASASTATSGLDFSATLLSRTYSPALSINPTFGYSQKIWGDKETPWYGFVRPNIVGVLSPSLYEGKIGIEVFPVSILGLDVKRTWSRRFRNTEGQDCLQVQCQGELNYTDVSLQSYLGAGDYFASIRWTKTFFDSVADSSRPVYDLGASFLIRPTGDDADFLTIAAGRDMEAGYSVGVLLQTADAHKSGQRQEGQYVFARSKLTWWDLENIEATAGLGRFKSSLNIAEFSAILSLTYTHTRALGFGR